MQDLRLVGVHDDGEHLLLSGTGGEMFQLPIDEALRVASSRTPAQVAARATTAPIAMSPRDIQARIRSGSAAAEIAELSGLPLANVQRYEGPVLAEREYVAQQARKIEVASPAPGHDIYRSVFGDNPATLGDMVAHRLTAHGIDSSRVEWDSWRRTDGSWTVVARFEANPAAPSTIGEEPPAMWTFSPARKSLQNANRWAQQLSELEPLDGPVPARRLAAVSDRPFDFEADGDGGNRPPAGGAAKDADGLLDMLRSRRGQRLGVDEDGDDALAALLTNGVPAAHPRPSEYAPSGYSPSEYPEAGDSPAPDRFQEDASEAAEESGEATPAAEEGSGRRRSGRPSILSRLSLAPRIDDSPTDDSLHLHDGVSTDTREITVIPAPLRPASAFHAAPKPSRGSDSRGPDSGGESQPPPEAAPPAPEPHRSGPHRAETQRADTQRAGLDELLGGAPHLKDTHLKDTHRKDVHRKEIPQKDMPRKDQPAAAEPERQPARPKRSSVPSWDEIVFGTRGD